MRDGQQDQNSNKLELQLVPNEDNRYQLLPFQASVFKLSGQGLEYRRVTIKLGSISRTVGRYTHTTTQTVEMTSTTSSQDDNPPQAIEKLAEELASIDIFERLLSEYLHTKNSSQTIDVAEVLYLEGHSHVAEASHLVDDFMNGEVLHYTQLPVEEQVYSLSRVLGLSKVGQEYLVEALRITRESRKLGELIRVEGERSRDHEATLQIVMNQITQYAQLRHLQNQKNQRLSTRVRWLAIGLGVATILGTLGIFYGSFFK